MATAPVEVLIYSRKDCHLCDEAKAVVLGLANASPRPFELREIDIDSDPDLVQRFGEEVPVVFIAGRKAFKYHVDEVEFVRKLERS